MRLLLLSTSTLHGEDYLAYALPTIAGHLPSGGRVAFVPYALADRDAYTARAATALASVGITVQGVHRASDPRAVVDAADAIFVGGGNTFRLLRALQRTGLLATIGERVRDGVPYVGSSAGTNVACPPIRTTNDMPITEPAGLTALGLVPFQINAHYVDADPASTHMGETREERLEQFLEDNDVPVLGMREGAWLEVTETTARLGGVSGSRLLRRGAEPVELPPGADMSDLLEVSTRYDT
ncbi:dipeptidase PepE [Mumia sp.]|uniref:dipeptidase PepE n=1 Tax=Mumia sp. TaxID=1965300 RepID=UPI0026150801|nr:dipeptidase PepE [Mumia sp.]MDD9348556.1 dipeptidase PepE [Mumia sp.]